jgi:hypothetical protein
MASTKVQRIMTQPIVSYLSAVRPPSPLRLFALLCFLFFIHIVVLFLIGLAYVSCCGWRILGGRARRQNLIFRFLQSVSGLQSSVL